MQDIFLFLQHHWALSTVLIIVLILLMLLEIIRQNRGSTRLSPAQAVQLINHKNAVVVDIRNTDSFANGHIVEAISVSPKELEDKQKKFEKFKSQPIILACATGNESLKTYALLQSKGFDVYMLTGGMRAWKEAGMPTVKS
jgi:rhodanese-related sulfurtransferase